MCRICRCTHESIEDLNAHFRSYHPNGSGNHVQRNEAGKYVCEFCDKAFSRKDSVYGHQRKVHGVESAGKRLRRPDYLCGAFKCEACGNMLASKTRLKTHMKSKHNIN